MAWGDVVVGGHQDDLAQRECQHGVECGEPLGRIVADLAEHQRAGLLVVGGSGEFSQVGRADLECDVEPPAVDAVAQPAPDDRVGLLPQVLADGGLLDDQFRQVHCLGPGTGAAGVVVVEIEPPAGGGGRVCGGGSKRGRLASHVVENPVEDQPQASVVQVGREGFDVVPAAVLGTNLLVVEGVVAVVGPGQVDRAQVDHVGAQVCDVAEVTPQAVDVTAPEIELVRPDLVLGEVDPPGGCLLPAA